MTSIHALLSEANTLPPLESHLLLGHVLQVDRSTLIAWPEKSVPDNLADAFRHLVERREQGEPIAYLIGKREFWSLSFHVDPSVLIPRPETELLVETVLGLLPDHERSILDLGTGSGAIAISLAKERPAWKLEATDASAQALAIAQQNAASHKVSINFLEGDWFEPVRGQYDAIISNPPYINPEDRHLEQGDLRFEPSTALVAPEEGMADLRKIIEQAPGYLKSSGWLLLEHGYDQGDQVRAALQARGFMQVRTHQDLAGCDRMSLGRWSPLTD